jgi:hypothetical protein
MKASGQLYGPAALPPEKETSVPTGYEAGRTSSRREILFPLPGIELRHVAMQTDLSLLRLKIDMNYTLSCALHAPAFSSFLIWSL